ncbi:ParE family toxin-like protein [Enterobacter huaxiensis]|uniref:ParE family toxin-like protein n=1 Tax=Enterobacter huaxiensis TaxID=2494702 RepID=UPI0040468E4A
MIPDHIIQKAEALVADHARGLCHPRRTYKHKYLTLEIGVHYRLLSRDDGECWELMTHEEYNKAINKKPH